MAQHLCIVSRDNPLLLGYLNIALAYLTRSGDELEIVIDRRPDPGVDPVAVPVGTEQRYLQGVDNMLRTRGYAIVSRAEGEDWRLSHALVPLAQEDEDTVAADETTESSPLAAIQEPLRRRLLLAVGAACVVIVTASVAIQSDALGRMAGVAGGAVAWLRSTPTSEVPDPAQPVASPAPPPAHPKVAPPETARTAEVTPPPASVNAPARAARVSEPPAEKAPPATPLPAPTTGPARLTKLAPPAETQAVHPQPATQGVQPPPALSAPKPETKVDARVEHRPEPKREATTAATVTEAPAEFSGVPRLEMRRERDASGRTSTITVRVTDAGGRPLPSADVRILRRINGGGIQETRLRSFGGDGSYRAAFPAPATNSDGLSMRVTVGRVSHEVPLAE